MPYERGHPQRSEQGLVEDPNGRQEERVYRRNRRFSGTGTGFGYKSTAQNSGDAVYISRSSEANSLADRNSRRHASRGPSSANLSNTLAVQQWACPGCPPVGLNLLADAELLAYLPEVMTTTLLKRLKLRKRFISWRRHFGETISYHRRVNPRSGKPQSS